MSACLRTTAVVATYRGEDFVAEQLESILDQEREVDEVVVSDDGSDDDTLAIIREVLSRAGRRIAVIILEGRTKGGTTTNVERALLHASGDVVLLADQDDHWYPHKVSTLLPLFTAGAAMAFSDADLVDADGRRLERRLWRSYGIGRRRAKQLAKGQILPALLRYNVVTGATAGFRRDVLDIALPLPRSGVHDWFLALVAAGCGPASACLEPLLAYRVHGGNQVGVPSRNPLELKRSRTADTHIRSIEAEQLREVIDRLGGLTSPRVTARLHERLRFTDQRRSLPDDPLHRLIPVLGSLLSGSYHRYGHGLRSASHDLVFGR
jgi:glycosyltransferase involved in cell wall biosynthesis